MSGDEAYSPRSDGDDYAPSEQQHTPTPFFPHSQAHAEEYEACVRGRRVSATSEGGRPKRMAAEQADAFIHENVVLLILSSITCSLCL